MQGVENQSLLKTSENSKSPETKDPNIQIQFQETLPIGCMENQTHSTEPPTSVFSILQITCF
jgi:hypothetical protein